MIRQLVALEIVAVLAVACGGNPIAPPLPPPPATPVTTPPVRQTAAPKAVLFVGRGGTKIPLVANFAQMLFDGSHSYGEGLTYLLEFGDGGSSTEPVATHRMEYVELRVNPQARLTARLTVTDRFGRSDSTEQPYVLSNLTTRTYFDSWANDSNIGAREENERFLKLTQDRASLSGDYRGPEGTRRVTGTVAEDGEIHLRTEDGAIEFSGAVEWGPGHFDSSVVLRLKLKGGLANGAVLDFYYDEYPY